MSRDRVVVPLRPGCSDGDALHVPKQGNYTQVIPPTPYLEKTAQQWMEARCEARPGTKYILDSLPSGYTMWQRSRPSDSKHVDKYLFGHPGQKPFDSPNRFYPHFQHLMDNNGSSIGCPCKVCAGSMGVLPRSTSSSAKGVSSSTTSSRPNTPRRPAPPPVPGRDSSFLQGSAAPAVRPPTATAPVTLGQGAQPRGRHKLVSVGVDSSRVDEEGTPDVYRNLVDKLRRQNTIDEVIEEPLSPDWRAEREILPGLLHSLKHQKNWVPRVGEVVLFRRDLPQGADIVRNEVTGEFSVFHEIDEKFLRNPRWEAGLVGETPAEPTSITDLHQNDSKANVIYSGVRVEPLPDPNSADKSLSKRHKYVSLRQTRPFVFWKELLQHVPQEHWHPTIINALAVMSTISLGGKHRFRGTWPDASIYCHALYMGSEMLAVGDTVRLLPSANKGQTQCLEVLVIKTIRLKWSHMDLASNNDYDEGRPYNSEVWVYGSAYTSDPLRVNKELLSEDNTKPPKAADAYGEWYPLHPTSKELAVPFTRILGRLYEQEAMTFWLNTEPSAPPTLDIGREALLEARAFARQHDQRIAKELDATWYWGDNRADALNLQTINGLEIAKYDQQRDIRDLRKKIKIIEGMDNGKLAAPGKPVAPLPLGSRGLRSFMAPGTADLPDRTHAAREVSMSDSATGSPSTGTSSASGKKRPHIINLSDDEDDEIRQHTRVVDDDLSTGKKKAKVAVIIG